MQRRTAYLLLIVPALVWCAGFIVAPLATAAGLDTTSLYAFYGRVCHQLPWRSWQFDGHAWAVCHRCSAVYLAFLVAGLALPFVRPIARWMPLSRTATLAFLFPLVLDGLFDLTGLHSASIVSRLCTGSIAGVGLAIVLLPLWVDALSRLVPPSLRSEGPVHA